MIYTLPGGLVYRPYLIDLIEGNHVLIAGTVGAGKSVLENSIIYSLLCTHFPANDNGVKGCKLVLLDPKLVELDKYKNLPHTWIYADNMKDIENALLNVRQLVDERLKRMKRKGIQKSTESPCYVFIDELLDLVCSTRGKEIIRIISDTASISRAANVFFVCLTQAPSRSVLSAKFKLLFNCKVALRCNEKIESRQIIGDDSACYIDKYGLGLVKQNTDSYRIVIPFYSNEEINLAVKHWTKQHPIYRSVQRLLGHRT